MISSFECRDIRLELLKNIRICVPRRAYKHRLETAFLIARISLLDRKSRWCNSAKCNHEAIRGTSLRICPACGKEATPELLKG